MRGRNRIKEIWIDRRGPTVLSNSSREGKRANDGIAYPTAECGRTTMSKKIDLELLKICLDVVEFGVHVEG